MKRGANRCALILLVSVAAGIFPAGCSQLYYAKVFRLPGVLPQSGSAFSQALLDNKLESWQGSDIYIRIVATWDSNNPNRMISNVFNISVQQSGHGRFTDTLDIDSISITFLPAEERHTLARGAVSFVSREYVKEPIVKTMFGRLEIPDEVETIRVEFVATAGNSRLSSVDRKEYSVQLTRYEGQVKKFGRFAID
jgi:hypothetical protein